MDEPSNSPDPRSGTGVGVDRPSAPRMPRWVKVFAIVVTVLVLVFVGLKLLGIGGGHGPGRHTGAGAGQISLSGVTADLTLSGGALGDHAPPEDGH